MSEQATLPPGPRAPLPALTAAWILRPTQTMNACRRRYGRAFSYRLPNLGRFVLVSDPALVKTVFGGDPRALHAGEANTIVEPVLGSNSILVLDEAPHLRQRKLMLPSFHGDRLARYGEHMRAIAEEELERWPFGSPEPARPHMQAITLEVIMRTVFGVDEAERLDRLRTTLTEFLEWTTSPRRLFIAAGLGQRRLATNPLFGLKRARAAVDALVYDEIRRRRADLDAAAERDDVLSLLVRARDESGEPMTDEEIRDELMTLLVAGHETTATALAWALERLSRHPEALAALDGGENEEYLDAVVAETLRLRPVIVAVARRLKEPLELGDWRLPAGVTVAPCVYLLHREPDIYPDPESFRPERFLGSSPGTYTWIPFGGGVRRCIGASFAQLEMKTVLATILRHARLRTTAAEPERIVRRAITFVPERGGRVVLDPA